MYIERIRFMKIALYNEHIEIIRYLRTFYLYSKDDLLMCLYDTCQHSNIKLCNTLGINAMDSIGYANKLYRYSYRVPNLQINGEWLI